MYPIYICEDDKVQRNYIQEVIENYIMIEELDMEIALATDNPKEILRQISENQVAKGIYLLDIDLKQEIDGIQLAQAIREVDSLGKIVFITSHAELAPLTFRYKLEALDYIVKNNAEQIQEQVIEVLNVIVKRQTLNAEEKRQYVFKSGSKTRSVDIDSILYFESLPQAHKMALHTIHGQYQFYDSLKNIEKADSYFIRVHKSFVANLSMIESVDPKEQQVKFKNGSTCPLALSRSRNLLKLLNKA